MFSLLVTNHTSRPHFSLPLLTPAGRLGAVLATVPISGKGQENGSLTYAEGREKRNLGFCGTGSYSDTCVTLQGSKRAGEEFFAVNGQTNPLCNLRHKVKVKPEVFLIESKALKARREF